jgi:hypothetical protein
MKILRSVLRRGSTVQSIGFYSILNADRWFPASRLHDSTEYPGDVAKAAASAPRQNPLSPPDGQEAPFLSEIAEFSAHDRRPVRSALILLAAIAIILLVLWWL